MNKRSLRVLQVEDSKRDYAAPQPEANRSD